MKLASVAKFKLPAVLEIIRSNIIKYGNPLALKGRDLTAWAEGLNLPAAGEVLFYTAGEYQMLPQMEALMDAMGKVEQGGRGFNLLMGVRNAFDKAGISGERLLGSMLARNNQDSYQIIRQAVQTLQRLGLEVAYLGEKELYSGALLYEFGYWEDLRSHAQRVVRTFTEAGAKQIIVLSPHTAEVLKKVYPQLVPGFNLEVKTFVEVVAEGIRRAPRRYRVREPLTVTLHDACRLARDLGVVDEIRETLAGIEGITVVEPRMRGRWTSCCGGPGKILFGDISKLIAARRVGELQETNAPVAVTFCPYCLANLKQGMVDGNRLELVDFAQLVGRGMEG